MDSDEDDDFCFIVPPLKTVRFQMKIISVEVIDADNQEAKRGTK